MIQSGWKERGAGPAPCGWSAASPVKERTSAEARAIIEALSHPEDALRFSARWMSGWGDVATLFLRTAVHCTGLQSPLAHPSATLAILDN